MNRFKVILFFVGLYVNANAQSQHGKENLNNWVKFYQHRTHIAQVPARRPNYWQQRADYVINAEVDDNTQTLTGSETITYYNNSPDALTFFWLQLDQNLFADQSMTNQTSYRG